MSAKKLGSENCNSNSHFHRPTEGHAYGAASERLTQYGVAEGHGRGTMWTSLGSLCGLRNSCQGVCKCARIYLSRMDTCSDFLREAYSSRSGTPSTILFRPGTFLVPLRNHSSSITRGPLSPSGFPGSLRSRAFHGTEAALPSRSFAKKSRVCLAQPHFIHSSTRTCRSYRAAVGTIFERVPAWGSSSYRF